MNIVYWILTDSGWPEPEAEAFARFCSWLFEKWVNLMRWLDA